MSERFEKFGRASRRFWEKKRESLREWFRMNGSKLFLFTGILFATTLAFEGGFLLGRDRHVDPIVITTPAETCAPMTRKAQESENAERTKTPAEKVEQNERDIPIARAERDASLSAGTNSPPQGAESRDNEACAFVGSRNSDKYHLPKCSWAKRIKPENRMCFASAADAESKGYRAGCVK